MTLSEAPDEHGLILVYDGECPVCKVYVRYMRIKESVGKLTLVDARAGGQWVRKIEKAGFDLNEGFVLIYGSRIYYGPDCIHMLALLSSGSGLFNRLNATIFKRPRLSKILYPILRFGRNLLLRLLGRSKIETS